MHSLTSGHTRATAANPTVVSPQAADPWIVRLARESDRDALYELASHTGNGLLNLPYDKGELAKRLAWSTASLERDVTVPESELYMLVLENSQDGTLAGSACIFSRIGTPWPFYSYKIATHTHVSRELHRSFPARMLHLVNDFDGASEVGGLFLHPSYRSGGLGLLLARSRYLFIARHRQRFSDRIIADLRGYVGPEGPPFWNAIGRVFFDRDFAEADHYNALHGNQFIADLMPRYPIYIDLLPEAARQVIGRTHDLAVPARHMLEAEGFHHEGYIDIFDGGPTLSARTGQLRTVRESRMVHVVRTGSVGQEETAATRSLLAAGQRADFVVWRERVFPQGETIRVPRLRLRPDETDVLHVAL